MDQTTKTPAVTSSPDSKMPSTTRRDMLGEATQRSGSTASEMVAAQTESEVKAGFGLARLNPRNEEDARQAILISCRNLIFANKCIYKKPVGGRTMEGPSIRFAEEMLRHWGNVKIIQQVIYDDPERRIVRVTCYDLQSNIPYTEDIIIEKTVERKFADDRVILAERINTKKEKVYIVVATEDEIRNKQAAQASKTIRNNGLRLIPAHIVEEAMETARKTVRDGVDKDPMAFKRKILDSFAVLGITASQIEKYLGKPADQILSNDIPGLQGVYNSIKDGETTWAEVMGTKASDAEIVGGAAAGTQPERAAFDPMPQAENYAVPSEYDKAMAEWRKRNPSAFKPGDAGTHQDVRAGARTK